ncbi:MAG: hypothetical protein VX278_24135 [Myxococcota bacterium]|nr:hypothetical protein [Myxococcota bacterium]
MIQRRLLPLLFYSLLIVVMCWPLPLHLHEAWLGYLNVDALDTISLRGLYLPSLLGEKQLFWPHLFSILSLLPNHLDHIFGLLFTTILPFPLNDNMWWICILMVNALSGHHLGHQLNGKSGGYIFGTTFLLCEPLLREVNLHHAPQSMIFWLPLYLAAVLRLQAKYDVKDVLWSSVCFAGACYSYWYFGLFLILGSLPLLYTLPRKAIALGVLLTSILVAPGMAIVIGGASPSLIALSPPDPQAWYHQRSDTPLFFLPFRSASVSNRISIVLILAALWGIKNTPHRKSIAYMALLGVIMLQGYIWDIGEEQIRLPFYWLGQLHPFLERLHWPQRWGIVTSLALCVFASHAPKPWIWLPIFLAETFFLSANAPLGMVMIRSKKCLQNLSKVEGPLLEIPFSQHNWPSVHQRLHKQPMLNPFTLPPEQLPPKGWLKDDRLHETIRALESGSPITHAKKNLYDLGIRTVYISTNPPSLISQQHIQRMQENLTRALGAGHQDTCMISWTLSSEKEASP